MQSAPRMQCALRMRFIRRLAPCDVSALLWVYIVAADAFVSVFPVILSGVCFFFVAGAGRADQARVQERHRRAVAGDEVSPQAQDRQKQVRCRVVVNAPAGYGWGGFGTS